MEGLAAQLFRSSMGGGRSAQQVHPRDVRRRTRLMADVMSAEQRVKFARCFIRYTLVKVTSGAHEQVEDHRQLSLRRGRF